MGGVPDPFSPPQCKRKKSGLATRDYLRDSPADLRRGVMPYNMLQDQYNYKYHSYTYILFSICLPNTADQNSLHTDVLIMRSVYVSARAILTSMHYTIVNGERFAGRNIRGFSPMKFFTRIFSRCLGQRCLLFNYSQVFARELSRYS